MIRVLLVEDNVLVARTFGRQLSRYLDVVDAVNNGEIALRRLELDAVDVVITDHDLGAGMSGLELARACRERWPHIPVIVVSGSLDVDALRTRTLAECVRACFAKPVPLDALLKKIYELCADAAENVSTDETSARA